MGSWDDCPDLRPNLVPCCGARFRCVQDDDPEDYARKLLLLAQGGMWGDEVIERSPQLLEPARPAGAGSGEPGRHAVPHATTSSCCPCSVRDRGNDEPVKATSLLPQPSSAGSKEWPLRGQRAALPRLPIYSAGWGQPTVSPRGAYVSPRSPPVPQRDVRRDVQTTFAPFTQFAHVKTPSPRGGGAEITALLTPVSVDTVVPAYCGLDSRVLSPVSTDTAASECGRREPTPLRSGERSLRTAETYLWTPPSVITESVGQGSVAGSPPAPCEGLAELQEALRRAGLQQEVGPRALFL
mmetsp:Transcript_85873/g.221031  ORF Transcript_85873/g.221031 Transcript_85873/m.221031 type:complete len:296 (+) Transcript_85873:69-956(+)